LIWLLDNAQFLIGALNSELKQSIFYNIFKKNFHFKKTYIFRRFAFKDFLSENPRTKKQQKILKKEEIMVFKFLPRFCLSSYQFHKGIYSLKYSILSVHLDRILSTALFHHPVLSLYSPAQKQ